jgi:archaetidylinositol phosphate synthase
MGILGMTGGGAIVRVHVSLLAKREKALLLALARRVPSHVTPDQLTALGVFGSVLVLIGCVAANYHLGFLLLASAGLVINWLGDSLDGTVARQRRIERHNYGFFIDQISDVTSHFLLLAGIGLSPLMHFELAMLALFGSMLVMFYGQLALRFDGKWHVSHGAIGPTELRLLLIAGMVASCFISLSVATPFGTLSVFDAGAALVFVGGILTVAQMFMADRARFGALDPGPRATVYDLPRRRAQAGAQQGEATGGHMVAAE